jgi:hypothetical protein
MELICGRLIAPMLMKTRRLHPRGISGLKQAQCSSIAAFMTARSVARLVGEFLRLDMAMSDRLRIAALGHYSSRAK